MPHATAAAEPLLEPPGVRSRFQGLRVGGGSKLAYCVVTVLPRSTAPAWRSLRTTVGVLAGDAVRPEPRAGRGRPVEDVEDVLDAERDAVQRAAPLAALRAPRSSASASARAPSRSTNTQARMTRLQRSMRSRQVSSRSTGA